MEKNNYQDEIESYLSGQMTKEERADFEKIIQNNSELAQDIYILKDIENKLNAHSDEQNLIAHLDKLGNKYFKSETITSDEEVIIEPIFSKKWIILSIVALLIGVALWWINTNTPKAPEQIFAAYYEPYPSEEVTRGNDEVDDYIKYYNSSQYDKAIPLLKTLISQSPDEDSYKIILGNSYLNTTPPNIIEAIQIFEELNLKETAYQATAKWYLALSFIKNKETEKAKVLLKELASQSKGKYPKRAQSLLEEL